MIKTLEIENFQGHQHSLLEFSSGVNILAGKSHSGKSSVIRALKWLFRNQPRGNNFKSFSAKKKDSVSVAVKIKNKFITREKGNDNLYKINDSVLAAVKSDIPQEVLDIANVQDINIQSQDDGYFLLKDSPGKVLSILNETVGLTIIDETLKKINSLVKKIKNDIEYNKDEIKDLKERKKEYNNLSEIEKKIKVLKKKEDLFLTKEIHLTKTNSLIEIIEEAEEGYETACAWVEMEIPCNTLITKADELEKLKNKLQKINRHLVIYEHCKKAITEAEKIITIEQRIDGINVLQSNLKTLKEKHMVVQGLLKIVHQNSLLADKKETRIQFLGIEFKNKLKKNKICPLCEQKIGD